MDYDQSISLCGLETTIRIEDLCEESRMKNYRLPLAKIYPLDIQYYTRIPCSLPIEKLEALVKERVLALKEIHMIMKSSEHNTSNEKRKFLTTKLGILRLHKYAKFINSKGHRTYLMEELEDRIADHASFIALRLALASNMEDESLHQNIEEELFYLRISALDDEGIRELLTVNEIEYEKVDDDEKIQFKDELIELLDRAENYYTTDYFKVPVVTLLGFLKINRIFLRHGIAFVPLQQMRAVLRAHYHNHLVYEARAINIDNLRTAHKFADVYDKFSKFFSFCRKEFRIMQQKVMKESNISVAMIDKLAETAFPPCMRAIHEFLRKHHHLKHESRLQYTLFLKGIGLKVQDTLTLFRTEFTKTVTLERFDKEYTYYIYHAYAMKGRRYDTPPKDCYQIIHTRVPFGDCNGCVFSNDSVEDIEDLGRKMTRWNIPEEDIDEMLEYTKKGQCGYACATYFHSINKCSYHKPVTHPNRFFTESRRISNLPAGCIDSESDDSNSESFNNDATPEILSNVKDLSYDADLEIIQMLIDWELQISSDCLKGGSMIKLKRKV